MYYNIDMDLFQAVTLGATQGLTEFAPVSSSGHLTLLGGIFGISEGADFHDFLELISFGTLIVLIIYYFPRLKQLFTDVFKKHKYKDLINIILTCIPAGLAGLLLSDFIDSHFNNYIVLACMMGFIGLLMIFANKLPHLSRLKNETQLTPGRSLAIGFAQILALVPGASRSGTTILAGRIMGLKNKPAADYSFLVSIALTTAVCLKSLFSAHDFLFANFGPVLLANLVALIIGLLVIKPLLKFLYRDNSLKYFGLYRLLLAAIILIFALN